ncbi:MAG: LamG domain-containing protein [Deltaproteobacteria bacterium]|nr:LamG domain-containing protein [Deltaproteobacteria bacterium]
MKSESFSFIFRTVRYLCAACINLFSSLHKKSLLSLSLLLVLAAALPNCGGSADLASQENIQDGSYLPLKLIKFLPSDQITGELHIYNSKDEEAYSTPLDINMTTGRVQSPLFELPRNERYAYVATFYVGNIPFAAVYIVVDLIEDGTMVEFTPEQVMIQGSDLDPNYTGHISLGRLPNFDLDADGYTNYHELVEGSNPNDANDIPRAPEVSGEIANGQVNIIKFELTFTDASEIIRVAPKNPVCGYHQWELIPQPESDGRIQKLIAEFNTRAYLGDSQVTLVIEATDSIGRTGEYSYDLNFSKVDPVDDEYKGPEIAVIRPERYSTVSGLVPTLAVACHEDGIDSLVAFNANSGDTQSATDIFEANIDTEVLGFDGVVELGFKAVDIHGDSREYLHEVTVNNKGEIKILSPTPNSEVRDVLNVSAYVDTNLMPDLKSFKLIEVIGANISDLTTIFEDNDALTDKFSSTQNLSFEPGEKKITLVFEAATPTKKVIRKVDYYINNDPDIRINLKNDRLDTRVCLEEGFAVLEWEVTNRDPQDQIYLYSSVEGTNFVADSDITTANGKGEKEIICGGKSGYWRIEAKRTADFKSTQDFALQNVTLAGSLSKGGNLKRILPGEHHWLIQGAPANQNWRVTPRFNGQVQLDIVGSGTEISPIQLAPRSHYDFLLELLNEQGEVITSRKASTLSYLSQDTDLVLWYPLGEFKDYNSMLAQEITGSVAYDMMINEISNPFYAAQLFGAPSWTDQDYRGLVFNGPNKYGLSSNTNIHASPNALTLELLVRVDAAQDAPYIFSKNGEFALGIEKNGDKYKFKGTLGLKNKICDQKGFGEGVWQYIISDTSYAVGEWHHVVMIYDANAKKAELFIDGISEKEVSPINFSLNTKCLYKHAVNALIYLDNTVANKGEFKGILSEVAVYKRILSLDEIKASCTRLGLCM